MLEWWFCVCELFSHAWISEFRHVKTQIACVKISQFYIPQEFLHMRDFFFARIWIFRRGGGGWVTHDQYIYSRKEHSYVYGHTTLKTPVLVRSPKLSNVGPGQYLDGWPPGNTGCSRLFHFSFLRLGTCLNQPRHCGCLFCQLTSKQATCMLYGSRGFFKADMYICI